MESQNKVILSEVPSETKEVVFEIPSETKDIIPIRKQLQKEQIQYFDLMSEFGEKVKSDDLSVYEYMYWRLGFQNKDELEKYSHVPRITDRCLSDGNYVKQYWHMQGNDNYCEFCYHNGCMDYTQVSDRSILLKSNICSCTKHGEKKLSNIENKWCGDCQCPYPSRPHYFKNVCKECNVIGLSHEEHIYCLSCVPLNTCICGKDLIMYKPAEFFMNERETYLENMGKKLTKQCSGCSGKNPVSIQKMYSVGKISIQDLSYCKYCYEQGCWKRYEKDFLESKITLPKTPSNHIRMVPIKIQPMTIKNSEGKDEQLYGMVPSYTPKVEEKKEDMITIVNTNYHTIEVECNSDFNEPETVYGYTCDCHYHRNDKPPLKLTGNLISNQLKYCGNCSEERIANSNRMCRNCKYFACTISTEYYCDFCAKEINICPCGGQLYTYDYEDYPDIKVARIHTSMGYLLGTSKLMETPLILAFPDYIDLYTKFKEKSFKSSNGLLDTFFENNQPEDKEKIKEYIKKLKSIEETFLKERNEGLIHPEIMNRFIIYDDYTTKVTKEFELSDDSHKKIVLEIRKVMLNFNTSVDFWIFTNDERYKYLRTVMTDGNALLLNKIVQAVDQNRRYMSVGWYDSYYQFKVQKQKVNPDAPYEDYKTGSNEIKYMENILIPEQFLEYFPSIISVVQEKGVCKTIFLNDIPPYFIKDENSIDKDVVQRMINNSKYVSVLQFGTYYFQPYKLIFLYQTILDYITSIGIETDEQGRYFHEDLSFTKDHKPIRTKTVNINIPFPADKGLLKKQELDDFIFKKYREVSQCSEKEVNKLLGVLRKQFLQTSYYDWKNRQDLKQGEIRELFYMFMPLFPEFMPTDIQHNRQFNLILRKKSELLYNYDDVFRKLVMHCTTQNMMANYPFLVYSSVGAIIGTTAMWLRIMKRNDAYIELFFNQLDGKKFKNDVNNLVNITQYFGMKDDLMLQCDKCKGYAVSRRIHYQTQEEKIGETYFVKYPHSKLCECKDELTQDELEEILMEKIAVEQRIEYAKLGLDYDKMTSKDESVRKAYSEELRIKREKECKESDEEYCFCDKCPCDENKIKIKVNENSDNKDENSNKEDKMKEDDKIEKILKEDDKMKEK